MFSKIYIIIKPFLDHIIEKTKKIYNSLFHIEKANSPVINKQITKIKLLDGVIKKDNSISYNIVCINYSIENFLISDEYNKLIYIIRNMSYEKDLTILTTIVGTVENSTMKLNSSLKSSEFIRKDNIEDFISKLNKFLISKRDQYNYKTIDLLKMRIYKH